MNRFLLFFAQVVTRTFFRRLTVLGREHVPREGPLVAVANHINGLVDPLLVFGALPRAPRILGKSTLWDLWYLRWFLKLTRVIPVYRRIDKGVDTTKNQSTFDLCHEALAGGDIIALFPEGIAHDFPELQPLRTGAARIALKAEERFGPLGVTILPIGITFDDKYHFRSNVLIQFGPPMPLAPEGVALTDAQDTVLELNERIDAAIRALTLNFNNWEEAERFAQTSEIIRSRPEVREALDNLTGRTERRAAKVPTLVESFELRKDLATVYPLVFEAFPEKTLRVVTAVQDYREVLESAGLGHDTATSGRPAVLLAHGLWMLFELLLLLPLTLLGLLLNYLPYRIVGFLASRSDDKHLSATYKVYSSVLVFPAFWFFCTVLLGVALAIFGKWSVLWSFAVPVLAPVLGWVALRVLEGGMTALRRIRAYFTFSLGSERRRVRKALREVNLALDDLLEQIHLKVS